MGWDVARSHEQLISSETTYWSAQKYFDKLVAKQSTCGILFLRVFDIVFVIGKGKGKYR